MFNAQFIKFSKLGISALAMIAGAASLKGFVNSASAKGLRSQMSAKPQATSRIGKARKTNRVPTNSQTINTRPRLQHLPQLIQWDKPNPR